MPSPMGYRARWLAVKTEDLAAVLRVQKQVTGSLPIFVLTT